MYFKNNDIHYQIISYLQASFIYPFAFLSIYLISSIIFSEFNTPIQVIWGRENTHKYKTHVNGFYWLSLKKAMRDFNPVLCS